MKDVLFVNSKIEYEDWDGKLPPIGLAMLASILKRNGFEVKIGDLNLKEKTLRSIILKNRPKIVCIGGITETRFENFKIAREVKQLQPGSIVIYGGFHASMATEDTLENIPDIDYIVRGEGEMTIVELVSYILKGTPDLKEIKGISYRKDKKPFHSPDRERVCDLDSLKLDYNLLEMDKYDLIPSKNDFIEHLNYVEDKTMYMMTSRGCAFSCSFCSQNKVWKTQLTQISVNNILDGIELLRNSYGYKHIIFYDDAFIQNKKHLALFCKEFRNRKIDVKWKCSATAPTLTKENVEVMKSASCDQVALGLESASKKILEYSTRAITPIMVKTALSNLKYFGIKTKINIIYGLPNENFKNATKTVKFVKKNSRLIDHKVVGICRVYPNTPIELYSKNKGILPPDFSWSDYYYDQRNLEFSASPHIPLLIENNKRRKELKELVDETYKERISFGLLCKKIKDIGKEKGLIYSIDNLNKTLKFNLKKIFSS